MTDASALLSEVSQQLARFPGLLDLLVGELDEATWRSRPAPAEWSPVEIVCHLRDEETEDFAATPAARRASGGLPRPYPPDCSPRPSVPTAGGCLASTSWPRG